MTTDQRFPLQWPVAWKRTLNPRPSAFDRKRCLETARTALEGELRNASARAIVLSTNVALRLDGKPYANQRQPDDVGVAAYFHRGQRPFVLACDRWNRVECNVWALAIHVGALRGQERWGVGTVEQAFVGYALPPAQHERSWRDVLGVRADASVDDIVAAHKACARQSHPDVDGGTNEAMALVNRARADGLKARGVAQGAR